MSDAAATREDFDRLAVQGCDACDGNDADCDHSELFLHPRCHIDSPTWTSYKDGVLTIRCVKCDGEVARVKVALAS